MAPLETSMLWLAGFLFAMAVLGFVAALILDIRRHRIAVAAHPGDEERDTTGDPHA